MGREGVLYTKTLRCSAPTISSIYTLQLSLDQKKNLFKLFIWLKIANFGTTKCKEPRPKMVTEVKCKDEEQIGGREGRQNKWTCLCFVFNTTSTKTSQVAAVWCSFSSIPTGYPERMAQHEVCLYCRKQVTQTTAILSGILLLFLHFLIFPPFSLFGGGAGGLFVFLFLL